MKRFINIIVLISFLYSNCVYAGIGKIKQQTLAGKSLFDQTVIDEGSKNLALLLGAMEERDVISAVENLRYLFAGVLKDLPEGINMVYNRDPKEVFLYNRNGIVHIRLSSHTEIDERPERSFQCGALTVDIFPFNEALLELIGNLRNTIRVREVPLGRLTHASYAVVPKDISGLLWMDGHDGLEPYIDGDLNGNLKRERANALRIRDRIAERGRLLVIDQLVLARHDGYDDERFKVRVMDGVNDKDKILNDIIEKNLAQLMEKLAFEDRDFLLKSLEKYCSKSGINIAILDRSGHWLENCRGDGFIGINRYLLEKINDAIKAYIGETDGDKRDEELRTLAMRIEILQRYLQAYLYHELRHEVFIVERELLEEMRLERAGLNGIDIGALDGQGINALIEMLARDGRDIEEDNERRQNGYDAGYFTMCAGRDYEQWIEYLLSNRMVEAESVFCGAVVVLGLAGEIKEGTGYKHPNELIIEDFHGQKVKKKARLVYSRYEGEYKGLPKEERENEYRDMIAYMLYQLGLTRHKRIIKWRKDNGYDRELAKRVILRLIDFISRNQRIIGTDCGRAGISIFQKRRSPIDYEEAAQFLTVSLLESGDFSQAVLRSELSCKTSGIAGSVTRSKREFWELIEEACAEQTMRGDRRYAGIKADVLQKANVEKEIMPKLRILYLFMDYINSKPLLKRSLEELLRKYYIYIRGREIVLEEDEIERFDANYKKVSRELAGAFGIDETIFDCENEDFLMALWSAFDFAENLNRDYESFKFTNPLIGTGPSMFTPDELSAISGLRQVFAKDEGFISLADIRNPQTIEWVRKVLGIYKAKIERCRDGLDWTAKRYGSSRDINGNKVWDLVSFTRGWTSSVWLAKRYSGCFKGGLARNALDLNAGLSLFYCALRKEKDIDEGHLSGLYDVISEPSAEYFGSNPDRYAGDITGGHLTDMRSGVKKVLSEEGYQLVTADYMLHNIGSPQRMFDIFKNVNQLLAFGGEFAVTLPPHRAFSEAQVKLLEEKMGFKLCYSADIHDSQAGAVKRGFYAAVFRKTGYVRQGADELKEKYLLIPEVVIVNGTARPVEPEERIANGRARGRVRISPETNDLFRDMDSGARDGLSAGLRDGTALKRKAVQVKNISGYKNNINIALDTAIDEAHKFSAFVKGDLRQKIDRVLAYKEEGYNDTVEKEAEAVSGEIEALKAFVLKNYEEFKKMLGWIKEKSGLAAGLKGADKDKYERVKLQEETGLDETVFKDAKDVYNVLQELERQGQKEKERGIFAGQRWGEFEGMQRLIRKYRIACKEARDAGTVLNADQDTLTEEIFQTAERITRKIAERFSSGKRRFAGLAALDNELKDLFEWRNCGFMFTHSEIMLLDRLYEEWEKEELGDAWKGIITNPGRLHDLIEICEIWTVLLKDTIDWDRGIARIFKDKSEAEYMDEFDRVFIYEPLFKAHGVKGGIVNIRPLMKREDIKTKLMEEGKKVSVGETLVLTVPDYRDIDSDFIDSLEKTGFEIRQVFKAHTDTADVFFKRAQTVIVLEKKRELSDTDVNFFNLSVKEDVFQDSDSWEDARRALLQDIDPEQVKLVEQEIMTAPQIRRVYPELAGGERSGIFTDIEEIKKEAKLYREKKDAERRREEERRQAEEARRTAAEKARKEREKDLIRFGDTALVEIRYGGIWTEGLVRDLAQILLKIRDVDTSTAPNLVLQGEAKERRSVSTLSKPHGGVERVDFDSEPDMGKILSVCMIKNHPILSDKNRISEDGLKAKIKELWEYRRYEIQIERMYRSFTRTLDAFLRRNDYIRTRHIDFEGRRVGPELFNVDKDGNKYLHLYMLGDGLSPFGSTQEELYRDIMGKYLTMRCMEADGTLDENVRMMVHCLLDIEKPAGITGSDTLRIVTGGESFGSGDADVIRLNAGVKDKIRAVFAAMSQVYQKKNMEIRQIQDIIEIQHMLMAYVLSNSADRHNVTSDMFNNITETVVFMIDKLDRLLSGDMTDKEYEDFKSRIRSRLLPLSDTNMAELRENEKVLGSAEEGRIAFYHYTQGTGGEREISVKKDDVIASRLGRGRIKVKWYLDLLKIFGGVRLYKLSEEEKDSIDRLIEEACLPDRQGDKYREKVIAYIRPRNTINRFIYFMFRYYDSGAVKGLTSETVQGFLNGILKGLSGYEPRARIYFRGKGGESVLAHLIELCRIQELTGEEALGEGRLWAKFCSVRMANVIHERLIKDMIHEFQGEAAGAPAWNLLVQELLAGDLRYAELFGSIFSHMIFTHGYDEYLVRMIFEGDWKSERMENAAWELHLYCALFPGKKEYVLRMIGRAMKSSRMNDRAVGFMRLLETAYPDEGRRLREILREDLDEDKNPLNRYIEMADAVIKDIAEGKEMREGCMETIINNQCFRSALLLRMRNYIFNNGDELLSRFEPLIRAVTGNFSHVYETAWIFYDAAENKQRRGAIGEISKKLIEASLERLMRFISEGKEDEVLELLMASYYDFRLIRESVIYGLSINRQLGKYMAELYARDDYRISAYAYFYIIGYFASYEYMEQKSEKAYEIICGVINKFAGSPASFKTERFVRAVELSAYAVGLIPGLNLRDVWQVLIDCYKRGEIEKDVLIMIGHNASLSINVVCKEFRTTNRLCNTREIRDRFGLFDERGRNILLKEAGQAGEAADIEEEKTDIIKMPDEPVVSIAYDGFWTVSTVRDLAQILLKLIPDFDEPGDIPGIINHPMLQGHPRLSTAPAEELLRKIEELIRYRQYTIHFERLYKQFCGSVGLLFADNKRYTSLSNITIIIDEDDIRYDVVASDRSTGSVNLHEYIFDDTGSPFALSPEEAHNELAGKFLAFEHYIPSAGPIRHKRMVVHLPAGYEGGLKEMFNGHLGGLSFPDTMDTEDMDIDDGFLIIAQDVIDLLTDLYKAKKLEMKYIDDFLKLHHMLLLNLRKSHDKGKAREMIRSIAENLGKFLAGEMTQKEYDKFMTGAKNTFGDAEEEAVSYAKEVADLERKKSGRSLFNYYMWGEGQEKEMDIGAGDSILYPVLLKLHKDRIGIKYYFDLLKSVKALRLYEISQEEKEILSGLVREAAECPGGDAPGDLKDRIACYINTANNVNRYLFFRFKALSLTGVDTPVHRFAALLADIEKRVSEYEPKIRMHMKKPGDINLISALIELYRLKQMLEGDFTEDEKTGIQQEAYVIADYTADLWDLGDLRQLIPGRQEREDLDYAVSAIGNIYHRDISADYPMGLEHMSVREEAELCEILAMKDEGDMRRAAEDCAREMNTAYIYTPEERERIVTCIGCAVVSCRNEKNVRIFLNILGRHNKELADKVIGRAAGIQKRETPSIENLKQLARRVAEDVMLHKRPIDEKVMPRLSGSQVFRWYLIDRIFQLDDDTEDYFDRSKSFFLLIARLMNAYEMYRIYTIKTAHFHNIRKQSRVLTAYAHTMCIRLVDIEKHEDRRQVKDILTGTFNNLLLMRLVAALGMNDDGDAGMRELIVRMFLEGDYNEAFCAYNYIKWYFLFPAFKGAKAGICHKILTALFDGVLKRDDLLTGIRFQLICDLSVFAVAHEPDFTLKEEWVDLIKRFRNGEINAEVFQALCRKVEYAFINASGELREGQQFGEKEIKDIERRFALTDERGENIFKKAVREHIVDKLARLADDERCAALRERLAGIIERVQRGGDVGLDERGIARLVWLLDNCGGMGLFPKIAEILTLAMGGGYNMKDRGELIMALQAAILAHNDLVRQVGAQTGIAVWATEELHRLIEESV